MISSVFGKTKPVNYILVLTSLFVCFILIRFGPFPLEDPVSELPAQTLALACLLFSVLAVNFIVQRNQLTGPHSYAIYFFGVLVLMFPESMVDRQTILANFFILLALRRLISLKSLRDTKAKIFDGTLWILISSLFLNWSVLFLALVWIHIYFYDPKNLRNWLVPLAAMAAFALIGMAVAFLAGRPDYFASHYRFEWEGMGAYWSAWGHAFKIGLYLLAVFLAGLVSFLILGKSGHGKVLPMRLTALTLLLTMVVVIFRSSDEHHPVLLTFYPSAVFLSKYVETVRRDSIREGVLLGSLVFCLVVFLGEWVGK